MRTRKHVEILKHHRNAAVYIDGRYLCVDMKISTRSKRGREIARETAAEILNAVGAVYVINDGPFEQPQTRAEDPRGDEPAPAGFEDGKSGLDALAEKRETQIRETMKGEPPTSVFDNTTEHNRQSER